MAPKSEQPSRRCAAWLFTLSRAHRTTSAAASSSSSSQMIASSFADFSLSELMRLLCFENEEQAINFLSAYSLKVSDTGQVRIAPCFVGDFFFFFLISCRFRAVAVADGKQKSRRTRSHYCVNAHGNGVLRATVVFAVLRLSL